MKKTHLVHPLTCHMCRQLDLAEYGAYRDCTEALCPAGLDNVKATKAVQDAQNRFRAWREKKTP